MCAFLFVYLSLYFCICIWFCVYLDDEDAGNANICRVPARALILWEKSQKTWLPFHWPDIIVNGLLIFFNNFFHISDIPKYQRQRKKCSLFKWHRSAEVTSLLHHMPAVFYWTTFNLFFCLAIQLPFRFPFEKISKLKWRIEKRLCIPN